VAWEGGRITWAGPEQHLPRECAQGESFNAKGALVVPGLVDCHTHLAFAGWRADEFELKVRGASYAEIAKKGGGILSTVSKTRAVPAPELAEHCRRYLRKSSELGVTTLEAKSGYGLSAESELKILEVYSEVASDSLPAVIPTVLAAHAVPLEFQGRADDYVALIANELIPEVAKRGLAKFLDIFVEEIAFSKNQARILAEAGKRSGLSLKLHVDQLGDGGGAALAAELGAVSADHLEHASLEGLRLMKQRGVVGVLLPFACLYAKQPPLKARQLLDEGHFFAVATDFNPGSAPSYHLPLALTLACTMSQFTPAEALNAGTLIAARALGLEGEVGSLEVGKRADMALIDAPSVNEWLYQMQPNACVGTIRGGNLISGSLF
jgi:imidazolonepropionase